MKQTNKNGAIFFNTEPKDNEIINIKERIKKLENQNKYFLDKIKELEKENK
jgi:hypothetical protein